MKNFIKNKGVTILVVTATIILAVIAILTAIRLYQLREEPVAPTAPRQPRADEPESCEELTFTLSTPTPTITTTPSVTVTSTPTSTPTEGPTSTPTTPALPEAGTSVPTLFGFGIGVLLITLALILAI